MYLINDLESTNISSYKIKSKGNTTFVAFPCGYKVTTIHIVVNSATLPLP